MNNTNIKNYFIIILTIILVVLLYDKYNKGKTISKQEKEIRNLNKQIETLKNEKFQIEDDKLFYKNLYIELAEEYNSKLHSLGIDEWIFTDTSR